MASFAIPARPEPLQATRAQTALVVIDMQNGYLSPGGYLDLAGFDISGTPPVIARAARVLQAARRAGLMVVHAQNGWSESLAEAGQQLGLSEPAARKRFQRALKRLRDHAEQKS